MIQFQTIYTTDIGNSVKNLLQIIKNVSYEDIVKYMYRPTDPSSLGVVRFLFGLLMVLDIPEERGGADLDIRWGNPTDCHFPLFPFLENPSFSFMSLLYGIMWIGALGITLGYKFKLSIFLFGIPYWYVLLLDKSFWNNHSYLYGLIAILLMGSSANYYFSVDALMNEKIRNKPVPYWNYFILKYQFFMLYFLAGLKKSDSEWLEGYSMTNLGYHWVFAPFRLILSVDLVDYLVVHWIGFLLDLTIGFWLLVEYTRPIAMLFCAMFHLMNSRLFSIGMFPYVCLATMPLFCKENWPKNVAFLITPVSKKSSPAKTSYSKKEIIESKHVEISDQSNLTFKHKLVVALLISHCGLQAFLPYSHFITKGYNNWTKSLYGYSWDMMMHSWDTILVVVKVVDNNSGVENFIDSQAWTLNDRWNKHADMCVQYAQCVQKNLHESDKDVGNRPLNLSIYIDVWCSLNKRFQQRMYNPNYDLLNANWSPFKPVEWLLPLLTEYSDLRRKMDEIGNEVQSWSNYSDVLFVADFPGLILENFINEELHNVSLTVLEGEIVYEVENENTFQSMGVKLLKYQSVPIEVGTFHKVHTVGSTPSCYMYIFYRNDKFDEQEQEIENRGYSYSPFPLIEAIPERIDAFKKMFSHIGRGIMHLSEETK